MKLVFLDTECTGLGENDRLIQVAYFFEGGMKHGYFRPPGHGVISVEAMSVHHITNEMIAGYPVFDGSALQAELQELSKDHVLVAHNAPFDLGMLAKENVVFERWIDTEQVAKHLVESPRYNLQFLK